MEISEVSIQLATFNPQRLVGFYRDVVGLPLTEGMGDQSFQVGPAAVLFIVDHSEISGPTAEPARAIIDLHITGIDAEHERLERAGVKFIRDRGVEFWGGVISTFEDPDGNRIQLMEYHPELARPEGEVVTA
ncbi:MAG: VOC family protein [Dehalococcoidia bacterium]|nr:VOC family protein [Dehalococcoidia bacterium]